MAETFIAHDGARHVCYSTTTGIDRSYRGCSHESPAVSAEPLTADFDAWLDALADQRRRSATPKATLKEWDRLHPDYQEIWRHHALRDVPDLLLDRVLAEYETDITRPASFVTMDFIRHYREATR